MKLFWATTEDHHEDWFVVASTAKQAAKLHEDLEGYNPGDAFVEEIMTIPADIFVEEPGWPTHELLSALGATFISKDSSRVVVIGGKTYCEGLLAAAIDEATDDYLERREQGRPNNTTRREYLTDDLPAGGDDDIDLDDIFGPAVMGICAGCDGFFELDDLGLCDSCTDKLARDMIRKRDWAYSRLAFGVPGDKKEDLRRKVIAQYGEKMELLARSGKRKSKRKRKKR